MYCIGKPEAVGDPRRVGNARGLAAGDDVELLEAGVARQGRGGEVHQLRADARIEDQLAAVDVDGARPAGREDEGLVLGEQHRFTSSSIRAVVSAMKGGSAE